MFCDIIPVYISRKLEADNVHSKKSVQEDSSLFLKRRERFVADEKSCGAIVFTYENNIRR